MPSLLLVVFVLQFLLHIINTVGASTIDELLWILYNKLPTPTSGSTQKSYVLKKEAVRLKRELGAVSAQDDFARWAKLQRQHDKALGEFQKLDNSLRSHRQRFTSTVSTLRWLGTQGLRFILQFWFAKSPMFYIPQSWVPYYVEWILSFPRAPLGSVSINIWGIACASTIALTGEALKAAYILFSRQASPVSQKAKPMAYTADNKTRARTEDKKEL